MTRRDATRQRFQGTGGVSNAALHITVIPGSFYRSAVSCTFATLFTVLFVAVELIRLLKTCFKTFFFINLYFLFSCIEVCIGSNADHEVLVHERCCVFHLHTCSAESPTYGWWPLTELYSKGNIIHKNLPIPTSVRYLFRYVKCVFMKTLIWSLRGLKFWMGVI